MKTTRTPLKMFASTLGMTAVMVSAAALFNTALAQDSAFLACGEFNDRAQRIACLEDALEAAMATRDAQVARPAQPATRSAVVDAAPAPPAPASAPAITSTPAVEPAPAQAAATAENDPSLLERLRNFGKSETAGPNASLSTDQDGQEQLHDTIAKLEKRRDLWIVTLSSGQVWKQEFPRTLNLREGDEISIYQAGIGNGYRMATPRLSGFIRVERLK